MQHKVNTAAMKGGKALKSLIQKAKHLPEEPLPTGNLSEDQLNLRLFAHHGLPITASVLAFDPIQRLLAVASLDGRIKIFGGTGIESIFQSPTRAPCNFLKITSAGQIIHITAENDIEVWDLENQTLACSLKLESKITAFSVVPGTPFMYLGNDVGTVSVLHYNKQQQHLIQLPYAIPAHVTLGGLVKAGSSTAPSVVTILLQLDAVYSRLVIAYANGLLVLWGLHEKKVLAVRGGTRKQREILGEFATNLQGPINSEVPSDQAGAKIEQRPFSPSKAVKDSDVEEEKEVCTMCWAFGNTLFAGYVDGDVWLWSFPAIGKNGTSSPFSSGAPLRKLDLAPGKSTRMPVIVLAWSPHSKVKKGEGSRLYVLGGREVGSPEVLTVLSLDEEASDNKFSRLELLLHGPFADLSLLPSPSGPAMAALLVLTIPGQLHLYDEAGIASCFSGQNEYVSSSSLKAVAWPVPLPDTTTAKTFVLPQDSAVRTMLQQLARSAKGIMPRSLPAGTSWPITGGKVNHGSSASRRDVGLRKILLTGLKSGEVQVWDASTPTLQLLHTADIKIKERAPTVSALDFCNESMLLAVGNVVGEVSLHRLSAESREVNCRFINGIDSPKGTESKGKVAPGFQCTLGLSVHQAAIHTLSIASRLQRLAAGDATGIISVLDLATWTLLYLGSAFDCKINCSISALSFATTTVLSDAITPSPPSSPFGLKKQPHSHSPTSSLVIYVANKEGSLVVIDGGMGRGVLSSGPVSLKQPSTVVAMYLLDANGAPTVAIKGKEEEARRPFATGSGLEASYALLCLEDSLRLYSAASVIQGTRKTLRKVKLQALCLQAFPFESPSTNACGILLLYDSGQVEVRSLPDLALVQERTLSTLTNYELQASPVKLCSWTWNGQFTLMLNSEELFEMSTLTEETDMRVPTLLPFLYDRDLATASEAAINASSHEPKKKSVLGGMMKDIKNGDGQQEFHSSTELSTLFSTRPFTVLSTNVDSKDSANSNSSHDPLEIDDIDLDFDESPASSPRTSMSRKEKLVNRLKRGFKVGKEKSTEADIRPQLLDGSQDGLSPHKRSADSIKAAYGHKPSGDSTSIAAMSRDKLIERQQKLQAMNKDSEEMQDGAQNFASLAEELTKQIENKKWYEL